MFIYHSMGQCVQPLFYSLSHAPWVCGGLEPTWRDEVKKEHTETNILGVAHMRNNSSVSFLLTMSTGMKKKRGGVKASPHMNYLYPLTNSNRSPAAYGSLSLWTD